MAIAQAQQDAIHSASTSVPSQSNEKPAVLIVGGLGYIGRFLALHIHKNNLASEVRLVDKVLPQLAWLAPEFAEACSQDKFMQADASREQSLPKIFSRPSSRPFTYVFNCGGETRYSQPDSVYEARSLTLTTTLATYCAQHSITYVEFSTGIVYKPPSSSLIAAGGCSETAPLKPWLKLAKYKLQAEEALERIAKEKPGFRYVILRLAHVYGEYDVGFLARGLCLARVYQSKGLEMKWLYGKELRIATVHVLDVCTAAWLAASWVSTPSPSPSPSTSPLPTTHPHSERIFNIVDQGSTSQAHLATLIHAIFSIPTGFQNPLINAFAKFNLESVVDDVNEDVLQPWADLLTKKGVTRQGPISPFLEKDLLRDCDLCLDGSRAARVLGWKIATGREALSEGALRAIVESYERIGWWP